MLYIKTSIKPSTIHGLGLFSEENIVGGTCIGERMNSVDVCISKSDFVLLPTQVQNNILHYAWKDNDGNIMLNSDNTRFINHSDNPNVLHEGDKLIAKYDINIGDEITDNYKDIGINNLFI